MQEQQRFVNFIIVSLMIMWVWSLFIAPKLFPPPVKPAPAKVVKKDGPDAAPPKVADKDVPLDKDKKPVKLEKAPHREDVEIGSSNPASGYRLLAKFNSAGAVLSRVQLLDSRYHDLDRPKEPLSVIYVEPKVSLKSLETDVPAIDA
ncbi:MAG: 60 kDa inner rane insertion protein, partial [Planctomycetaceae bacterium]|nr:60 kDa inner rane insertion protein [Planctomycetaceae bacterium]